MPISTAIRDVMANQSRVFHASRAALETCAQVGDGADDGGEDERYHGGLQQRDVARADGLQGGAEGVGVGLGAAGVLGQQAKAKAHEQGGDDLEAERAGPFGQLEAGRFLRGRGCLSECSPEHARPGIT